MPTAVPMSEAPTRTTVATAPTAAAAAAAGGGDHQTADDRQRSLHGLIVHRVFEQHREVDALLVVPLAQMAMSRKSRTSPWYSRRLSAW